MMSNRGRLIAFLMALTLFGCKGPVQTSAASTGDGSNGAAGVGANGAASSSGGTRVEKIVDTTLNNMVALDVTVPANWKFQGVLLQGSPATCDSQAYAVFRATSPDGQSFAEEMPEMLWDWGNGPRPTEGCLPLNGPISAQNFLKYISAAMQVAYVGDAPLPEAAAAALKKGQAFIAAHPPTQPNAAQMMPGLKMSGDAAAAFVRYNNHGVAMRGRMTVGMTCFETTRPGVMALRQPMTVSTKCNANVEYLAAPETQFASVARMWDAPGMGFNEDQENKEWNNAWSQRRAQQMAEATRRQIQYWQIQQGAQMQQTEHAMYVSRAMMVQTNQIARDGLQQSMDRAAQIANSNHDVASDFVDMAFDQRTVMNPNTGEVFKISNQENPPSGTQLVHGDGRPQ
jgi:hypothetical protein